ADADVDEDEDADADGDPGIKVRKPFSVAAASKKLRRFHRPSGPVKGITHDRAAQLRVEALRQTPPAHHRPSGSDVDFQVAGGGVHAVSAWATMDPEGRAVAGPRVGCGAVTVASADTQS